MTLDFAVGFQGISGNLIMDGFPVSGFRILDAANRVNQLETKLYSHADVNKSNTAAFENEGFYCFNRKLPIVYVSRNTDIAV